MELFFVLVSLCCTTLISAVHPQRNCLPAESQCIDNNSCCDGYCHIEPGLQYGICAPSSLKIIRKSFIQRRSKTTQHGICTHYSDKNGTATTSSGYPYDPDRLTAAHQYLPYNTMVLVSAGRRAVIVKINDRERGPHGPMLQLSRRAAESLQMHHAGPVRCAMEVLRPGDDGRKAADGLSLAPRCQVTWFGACDEAADCCSHACRLPCSGTHRGICVPGSSMAAPQNVYRYHGYVHRVNNRDRF